MCNLYFLGTVCAQVCSITYARIQGKNAMVAHFQNSSLLHEDKRCRPVLFHSDGVLAGAQSARNPLLLLSQYRYLLVECYLVLDLMPLLRHTVCCSLARSSRVRAGIVGQLRLD